MIEYKILIKLYLPNGSSSIYSVKCSDRESGIKKYKYLQELFNKKSNSELMMWMRENVHVPGALPTSIEGLYGVSAVKIL